MTKVLSCQSDIRALSNRPRELESGKTCLTASIAAIKIAAVRAGLIHDVLSVRLGVEDDDMNVVRLGGKVAGPPLPRN